MKRDIKPLPFTLNSLLAMGLLFFSQSALAHSNSDLHCDAPYWNAPAESEGGIFRGDLIMDCWLSTTQDQGTRKSLENSLERIKNEIIKKIQTESTIHEGPHSSQLGNLSSLIWDVSHKIKDNGDWVLIREDATLATDGKNQLIYKTQSKKVSASGMASYLRKVHFSFNLEKTRNQGYHFEFQNKVEVERPWYALDLIFAPIARNVCFEKMAETKEKIIPWLIPLLEDESKTSIPTQ